MADAVAHVSRTTAIGQSHWFQCGRPDQRREFAEAVLAARQAARRNRHLVLAHADLAAQLVGRLGYQRPDQWHGYIPPRFHEAGSIAYPRWYPNESPRRAVLLELVAQAEARAT